MHRRGVRLRGDLQRRGLHAPQVSQRLLRPGPVQQRDMPVPTRLRGRGLLASLLRQQLQQEGRLQRRVLRVPGRLRWGRLQLW